MNRVLDAFKPHCADSVLPRTLGNRFKNAGFNVLDASAYPIVNADWSDENYSTKIAPFITGYIKPKGHRQIVSLMHGLMS